MILILLRDRNNKPKVGLGQLLERALVTCFDSLGKLHLLIGGNELNLTNLLQVFVQRSGFAVGDLLGDL